MTLAEQLQELDGRNTVVVTSQPRLPRVGAKAPFIVTCMGPGETRTLALRDQYGLTGQLVLRTDNAGRFTWALTGKIKEALDALR